MIQYSLKYTYEYIIEHDIEWINNLALKIMGQDARDKLWELQKIILSRQPQTEDDAFSLSNKFEEVVDGLEDIIRASEGKKKQIDLHDGEVIMVS